MWPILTRKDSILYIHYIQQSSSEFRSNIIGILVFIFALAVPLFFLTFAPISINRQELGRIQDWFNPFCWKNFSLKSINPWINLILGLRDNQSSLEMISLSCIGSIEHKANLKFKMFDNPLRLATIFYAKIIFSTYP